MNFCCVSQGSKIFSRSRRIPTGTLHWRRATQTSEMHIFGIWWRCTCMFGLAICLNPIESGISAYRIEFSHQIITGSKTNRHRSTIISQLSKRWNRTTIWATLKRLQLFTKRNRNGLAIFYNIWVTWSIEINWWIYLLWPGC